MRTILPIALAYVACSTACSKESAPDSVGTGMPALAAATASSPRVAPPSPAAPASSTPPSADAASAKPRCEVEISGRVTAPANAMPPGQAFVYVFEGDCLAPSGTKLGRAMVLDGGKFFIEVFSSWGADLTVCAAVEDRDRSSVLYGKAPRSYHAEAIGEVELKDVVVALKPGPARSFGPGSMP